MTSKAYEQGNYRVVADRLRPAAQRLVDLSAVEAGRIVVDVGSGTGNVADAALDRACRVLAIDLAEAQVRAGQDVIDRGAWPVVGDGLRMPVRSGSVDAALAAFCVMYADVTPAPVLEMARVVRAGGVIGITTWAAGGFQVVAHAALANFGIGGAAGLTAWSQEDFVRGALSAVAAEVQLEYGELRSTFPSVEEYWAIASASSPPLVAARSDLSPDAFDALGDAFRAAARSTGVQATDGFTLVDRYIVATGRVTGR